MSETAQETSSPFIPVTSDEGFYVTIRRDGKQVCFLLGPFATWDEASAQVETGRELAREADPFTAFDAFGTARVQRWTSGSPLPALVNLPAGKMNAYWELHRGE